MHAGNEIRLAIVSLLVVVVPQYAAVMDRPGSACDNSVRNSSGKPDI